MTELLPLRLQMPPCAGNLAYGGYEGTYQITKQGEVIVLLEKGDLLFGVSLRCDPVLTDQISGVLLEFLKTSPPQDTFGMMEPKPGDGSKCNNRCDCCGGKREKSPVRPESTHQFRGTPAQKLACYAKITNDVIMCTLKIMEEQVQPVAYAIWYLEVGSKMPTEKTQYEKLVAYISSCSIVPRPVMSI